MSLSDHPQTGRIGCNRIKGIKLLNSLLITLSIASIAKIVDTMRARPISFSLLMSKVYLPFYLSFIYGPTPLVLAKVCTYCTGAVQNDLTVHLPPSLAQGFCCRDSLGLPREGNGRSSLDLKLISQTENNFQSFQEHTDCAIVYNF